MIRPVETGGRGTSRMRLMPGDRIGHLVVVEYLGTHVRGRDGSPKGAMWATRCECGKTARWRANDLRRAVRDGEVIACGNCKAALKVGVAC